MEDILDPLIAQVAIMASEDAELVLTYVTEESKGSAHMFDIFGW